MMGEASKTASGVWMKNASHASGAYEWQLMVYEWTVEVKNLYYVEEISF